MVKKFRKLIMITIMMMAFVAVSSSGLLAAASEWKADGIISENEYTKQQQLGEIEFFTRIEGEDIMIATRAKTQGYIALGIDPEQIMKGADMVLMYVKEGKGYVEDMFCTGLFGPHPADTVQGGTMDIEMISGSEKNGQTLIEFKRKLDTGDKKDKPLKKGNNKVIWAVGNSDDITKKHTKRGAGTLVL